MERQKSMEKGLLRKSLSIRERKVPNEDVFLEAGLSRKSPREAKKPQNDDGECRVTASVFLSTFVAVSGSFCTGCGVSLLFSSIRARFNYKPSGFHCLPGFQFCSESEILAFNWLNRLNCIGFVGGFFIWCAVRDYRRFISLCCWGNEYKTTIVFKN